MRTTALLAAVLALTTCSSHGGSVTPRTSVRVHGRSVVLNATDRSGTGVAGIRYRLDGGPWREYGAAPVAILDRTPASFARWRHDGPGAFVRTGDGSVRTVGGLGMLWYPRAFGGIALHLQWRDVGGGSNSGVLIRFPDPLSSTLPCARRDTRPEWVAIECGHEVQINDGSLDEQKTGSVYGFAPLTASTPGPGPWNDYEIRVTGGPSYRVVVLRNGTLLNNWVNRPGQAATRPGDPATDERQLARGYVGLQNHSDRDVIVFRDVAVTDLRPTAGALAVSAGRHVIEVTARDWAGGTEPARRIAFTVS